MLPVVSRNDAVSCEGEPKQWSFRPQKPKTMSQKMPKRSPELKGTAELSDNISGFISLSGFFKNTSSFALLLLSKIWLQQPQWLIHVLSAIQFLLRTIFWFCVGPPSSLISLFSLDGKLFLIWCIGSKGCFKIIRVFVSRAFCRLFPQITSLQYHPPRSLHRLKQPLSVIEWHCISNFESYDQQQQQQKHVTENISVRGSGRLLFTLGWSLLFSVLSNIVLR